MESPLLSPLKRFRTSKNLLILFARGAMAWILVCGLCVTALPAPAFADAGSTSAKFAEEAFRAHFAATDFAPERQAPVLAYRFASERSQLPTARSNANFEAFTMTTPLRLETPALAMVGPVYAVPRAALPAPGAKRKRWVALSIGGLAVAGVGAGVYAAGHSGICSGPNPSTGCDTARDVGLALMPLGAVMAVAGFVMLARH